MLLVVRVIYILFVLYLFFLFFKRGGCCGGHEHTECCEKEKKSVDDKTEYIIGDKL